MTADQRLALAYAKGNLRPFFAVLLQLDAELGAAVSAASEPMLGQIRLAWWRDAIASGRDEAPLLAALRAHDVDGRLRPSLAAMVDGWETLLQPVPLGEAALKDYAEGRGRGLFRAAACVAGGAGDDVGSTGAGWALIDFAFHCSDVVTAEKAFAMGRLALEDAAPLPGSLRPFQIMTRFARSDIRRGLHRGSAAGSPARIVDALRVVLTGR